MPDYEVLAVSDNVRDWKSGRGDEMKSYRIHVKAPDGAVTQNVELAQKAATKPPAVGEKIDGTIDTTGSHGPKLKKNYAPGGGRGGGGRSPEENSRIVRQHSQEMAIRYVGVLVQACGVSGQPLPFDPSVKGALLEAVKEAANVLDTDAMTNHYLARNKPAGATSTGGA